MSNFSPELLHPELRAHAPNGRPMTVDNISTAGVWLTIALGCVGASDRDAITQELKKSVMHPLRFDLRTSAEEYLEGHQLEHPYAVRSSKPFLVRDDRTIDNVLLEDQEGVDAIHSPFAVRPIHTNMTTAGIQARIGTYRKVIGAKFIRDIHKADDRQSYIDQIFVNPFGIPTVDVETSLQHVRGATHTYEHKQQRTDIHWASTDESELITVTHSSDGARPSSKSYECLHSIKGDVSVYEMLALLITNSGIVDNKVHLNELGHLTEVSDDGNARAIHRSNTRGVIYDMLHANRRAIEHAAVDSRARRAFVKRFFSSNTQ